MTACATLRSVLGSLGRLLVLVTLAGGGVCGQDTTLPVPPLPPPPPAGQPSAAPKTPSLGGIPLEVPKESQTGKGAPSVGGIPLQVPNDTLGAKPPYDPARTVQRPIGRRPAPSQEVVYPPAVPSRQYPPTQQYPPNYVRQYPDSYYQQPYTQVGEVSGGATYQYVDQEYDQYRGLGSRLDDAQMGYMSLNYQLNRMASLSRAGVTAPLGGIQMDAGVGLAHDMWLPGFYGDNGVGLNSMGLGGQSFGSFGFGGFGYGGPLWSPRSFADSYGRDSYGLRWQLGPLLIDQVYIGAGAVYTELSGIPPEAYEDDGFGSILWMSARVTLGLSDTFQISIRPMIYWLPQEGEVGYALGAFLGFPGLSPTSYATATYAKEFGNYELLITDQFGAYFDGLTLLDNNVSSIWLGADHAPIDYIGRYTLGGGTDFGDNQDVNLNNDPFDEDNMYWANRFLARVVGHHGSGISSVTYFDRQDRWNHDFEKEGEWIHTGVWAIQERPYISPYAGYDIYTADDFDTSRNTAIAGFKWVRPPHFSGYVQGGYTTSDEVGGEDSWLGEAGIFGDIGPHTHIGASGGRRVSDYPFRDSYVEDYVQGSIFQELGPNTAMVVWAGQSELVSESDDPDADDATTLAAVNLIHQVACRTTVSALVGYEDVDNSGRNNDYYRWTYRLGVIHEIGLTVQLNAFYQYQDSRGEGLTEDFSEHLIFVGATKRL